jgi:glyoxylase-like metal-dependent hydrolase (beta-lactamase superfamily II)
MNWARKPPDQNAQQPAKHQRHCHRPAKNIRLFASEISSSLTGQQIETLSFLWFFDGHTFLYQEPRCDTSHVLAVGGNSANFSRMNLEDHLGDIIRKARIMSDVSGARAAGAAGVSEAELSALEASGILAKQINYAALGKIIGLNPQKLETISKGWLPARIDLSMWHELRPFTTTSEDLSVNCYLLWDEVTRDAALFDTGLDARPVLDCIAAEQLLLRHIFITHSHYDHVEALPKFREVFPKVRLHSGSKSAPVDQRNKVAEIIHLGGLRVTHRETPGHADDGVTYLVGNWQEDAPSIAIVGDALFAGSMGNGNGAWDLARQKVREQILSLPPETLICPGHGPLTTVGEEREHNPFF